MKDSSRQLTYEGKDVFIGIDVHKRTYSVVSMVEGEIVNTWPTLTDPKKLAEQLRHALFLPPLCSNRSFVRVLFGKSTIYP